MTQMTEERFTEILSDKLAPLATRNELHEVEHRLIGRIEEAQGELARITGGGFGHMQDRFDEIEARLDVTEQLKSFERKFQRLEEALHIKL